MLRGRKAGIKSHPVDQVRDTSIQNGMTKMARA
jgi:hypothetical protein